MRIYIRNCVRRLKDELTEELLQSSKIIVLAGIKAPLSVNEVTLLKTYVEKGGSVLVLAEANSASHYYNALTQNFGISIVRGKVHSPSYSIHTSTKHVYFFQIASSGQFSTNTHTLRNVLFKKL